MSQLRLVLCLSLAAACTAEQPAEQPPQHRAFPIVGGTTDMGDPAVAIIAFEANEGGTWYGATCTGTLISPHVVITAAHCADSTTRNHQVYFGYNPYGTSDPTFLGLYNVTMKQVHPAWDPSRLDAGNDLALLLIDGSPAVTPKPMNRTSITSSNLGDTVRIVGFGITGPSDMTNPIKRQANTTLTDFNFNLIVDGSSTTNTCSGDSGGPHFMTIGGTEVLVGVTSFGDVDCAMYGAAGRVDYYAVSFIDPFVTTYDGAVGCGSDGGCASGCGSPDPDCPCAADGFCTTACPDISTDPDCPTGCGAEGHCIPSGCPTPDPDCTTTDPCSAEGTCHTNCATRDPDCPLAGVGEPCNGSADCVSGICVAATDDDRIHYCTDDCDPAASDCPSGMTCVAASGDRHVCAYDEPTPGALGSPCDGAEACIDGLCLPIGGDGADICSALCTDADPCPNGYECVDTTGTQKICTPAAPTGGDSGGGCEAVPGGGRGGAAWILVLAGLAPFLRRRRRARG